MHSSLSRNFRVSAVIVTALVISFGGAAFAAGTSALALPPPPAQPPGLDHFLCYNASVSPAGPPFPVIPSQLANQFPNPILLQGGTVDLHCNPATKKVVSAAGVSTIYPAQSPSWHLLCIGIQASQGGVDTHLVKVSDQFGAAKLITGAPSQFCLPSLKTLPGVAFKPPAAGEITPDHFTCYPVRPAGTLVQPFTQIPPIVKVKDQFTGTKVQVRVGPPSALCLPTLKALLPNGPVTPITNATAHLLCFQVTTPAISAPLVFDENQFNQQPFNPLAPGPGFTAISIGTPSLLCLPSYKRLIS